MAAKDDLGAAGEDRATQYLTEHGYLILDRNWRSPQGEIDIVAALGTSLVIVEVKTRRTSGFGHPFEAIDARKRRRLWQLANAWMQAHPESTRGRSLRLDAIGIVGDDPWTAPLEHLRDLS